VCNPSSGNTASSGSSGHNLNKRTASDGRLALEVELIGSHPSDIKHVDPSCRMCYHVRAILLAIADRLTEDPLFPRNRLTYDIDTHSNSILCLPALGNRAAVPVSINISWNHAPGSMCEGDLQSKIKTLLAKYGIHQR
jgi:hypothetical protein